MRLEDEMVDGEQAVGDIRQAACMGGENREFRAAPRIGACLGDAVIDEQRESERGIVRIVHVIWHPAIYVIDMGLELLPPCVHKFFDRRELRPFRGVFAFFRGDSEKGVLEELE